MSDDPFSARTSIKAPPRWLWALLGVASIVAGVIVLVRPGNSLATLAVVTGIFLLADGVFEIAASFGADARDGVLPALIGIVDVIVGVVLIRHPFSTVAAIGLLLGVWFIAVAFVRMVRAIRFAERVRDLTFGMVTGAVQLIAGIVIVAAPGIGFATLAVLVGLSFIVYGVALIAVGAIAHAAGVAVGAAASDRGASPA